MKNYFIKEYEDAVKNRNMAENEKAAFNSIIEMLFKQNIRGWQKAMNIDEYDGESIMGDNVIIPGTIYAFQYQAKNPSIYKSGNISFEWSDTLPIVLVTGNKENIVSGINLNLCNPAVRVQIINMLYNIDENFYVNGEAERMSVNGRKPLSEEVMKIFLNDEKTKEFYNAVIKICNLKYTGFICRHYNIKNIRNPRLIETWQYKYIPFLRYHGDLKDEVLKLIWSISGMNENQ